MQMGSQRLRRIDALRVRHAGQLEPLPHPFPAPTDLPRNRETSADSGHAAMLCLAEHAHCPS